MQPTNCCCYSQDCTKKAYYKLMLLLQDYTDITNAICKLLLLLQDKMKNAYCYRYCKMIPQMHTTNWCCYCKIIPKMLIANCCFCKVLLSLRSVVKFAYWKLLLKLEKYNATLTVYILCFPPVHSTKEQRLLQCSNIFTSYDTKF